MAVGQEGFGPLGGPLDRTAADALGRPQADGLLGIDEDLRAEAAADVGRDDAQLVLRRDADEGRQDQARDVRILGRVVEREVPLGRVVGADRRTRLDGEGNEPVVGDVEVRHVGRLGKGRLGLGLVAEGPLEDRVAGSLGMNLRSRRALRLGRVDDGRQHVVVDDDALGAVAGLVGCLGDDDGDDIADIAGHVLGDRRVGAGLHRRAVLGMDQPAADETADAVVGEIGAGEHGDDARCRLRLGRADRLDAGMGVRRAHEGRVGHALELDVVGVPALAGDEAPVFLAKNTGADAVLSHGATPSLETAIACRFSPCPHRYMLAAPA